MIAGDALLVYENRGSGVFAEVRRYPGHEGGLRSVALADLDGDGALDAVVGNRLRDVVEVFWNQGDGSFSARLELPAGGLPWGIKVGDLDSDGRADIVATVTQSQTSTSSVIVFTSLGTMADSISLSEINRA